MGPEQGNVSAILAREGVDSAEGLLEKHRAAVWRMAYRFLQDAEDALDVTQDVLLKLHHSLSRLRPDTRVAAWLMRVTANTSLNVIRRERTRRRHHALAGQEAVTQVAPRSLSGLGDALAAALAELPRGQRGVVTLRLLEERSFPEVAAAFGVSESTVKVQFSRGIRRLRASLRGWDLAPGRETIETEHARGDQDE